MSDTPDSLIRKIQKLLALAESPNEHEAQAAAAKAQELLAIHGLEMAEINAKQDTPTAAAPRVKEGLSNSAMYTYQRELMATIARNNFCYHTITERTKEGRITRRVKTHTLIGSKLNVTVASMMYDYLIQTMDRLLPWQGTEKRGKNALLWLSGCSDRLQSRLDQMRYEQEKASEASRGVPGEARGDGRSLVLADVYGSETDLNADFRYGYEPGTTARNRAERAAQAALWRAELVNQPAPVYAAKRETDAQRAKRKDREQRRHDRWNEQWERRYAKEQARRSDPAYRAGSDVGGKIGLDRQVGNNQGGAIPLLPTGDAA